MASLQRLGEWIHNHRCGLNKEERAVLKHYTEMLALAKRPAFASGKTFDLGYCQGEGFDPERDYAFLRSDGREVWLVAAHFAPYPSELTIRIPDGVATFFGVPSLPGVLQVNVEPNDAAILKLM